MIDSANKAGFDCRITKIGRKTNNSMPAYCVQQALEGLSTRKSGKFSASKKKIIIKKATAVASDI